MASLLPLIHDILPMLMPAAVAITRAAELFEAPPSAVSDGNDETGQPMEIPEVRVIRRDAIVDKSDKLCASVVTVKPKSSSLVYHHGEQDAILYIVSGTGFLLTSPKDDESDPGRHELGPGDFAFVPSWTEHQLLNQAADAELVCVVTQGGASPVEVGLTDWGGPEVAP